MIPEEIRVAQERHWEAAQRKRRRQRRDDIGFRVCIVGLFVCGIAELIIAGIRIAT